MLVACDTRRGPSDRRAVPGLHNTSAGSRHRAIGLSVQVPLRPPRPVDADVSRALQVSSSLLSNAIVYRAPVSFSESRVSSARIGAKTHRRGVAHPRRGGATQARRARGLRCGEKPTCARYTLGLSEPAALDRALHPIRSSERRRRVRWRRGIGLDHRFGHIGSVQLDARGCPGTPDSSGSRGRATSVARARHRGGLKSAPWVPTQVGVPWVPTEVGVPGRAAGVSRLVGEPERANRGWRASLFRPATQNLAKARDTRSAVSRMPRGALRHIPFYGRSDEHGRREFVKREPDSTPRGALSGRGPTRYCLRKSHVS
ncbi:hypothetical protein BDD21_4297 [Thiocapsa rosea]|uniref:Uncharacterized protein n=1 Tax=Thiocapsa rosea TaxID=69360 RepID=A0A495VBX3_9GAMM|nr:hypothetical protein BDD21_4297 [Thiocapsa rosea]